jgi:hypothetical protein
MYSIIKSDHAKQRAAERGMPRAEFDRCIRQAQAWGDAVYVAPHGKVVVENLVATTVLDAKMRQKDARLIERTVTM